MRLAAHGRLSGPSYVAVPPEAWPPVAYELRTGPPSLVDTGAFTVRIESDPLALAFEDDAGAVVLRAPIARGMFRESVRRQPATPPDAEVRAADERQRLIAHFEWVGAQHFYGLGEGGKQFDRLDGTRQLWNSGASRSMYSSSSCASACLVAR